MKTIRNSVFETNSSSMHSISLSHELAVGDFSGTHLYVSASGDYGWGPGTVDGPEEKLDYAIVAYLDMNYESLKSEYKNKIEKLKDIDKLSKRLVEKVTKDLNAVVEAFAEHGVTVEFGENLFQYDEDGTYYVQIKHDGYIDHQSGPHEDGDCAAIAEMVEKNPQRLFNFCFNSSYIELDNDNH